MTSDRTTKASQFIHAPREAVYEAFFKPEALAAWLAPDTMKGYVETLEPRVGGKLRMSLKYTQAEDAARGKSSGDTDTFEGKFVEIIPNEKIVWVTEFESDQPDMAGEMKIIWTLADADGGTEVTVLFEGIPKGVRLEDNETGSRQSLRKLAAYVERDSNSPSST